MFSHYILPFLIASVGTYLLLHIVIVTKRSWGFLREDRTENGVGKYRVGGLAMIPVFLVTLFVHPDLVFDTSTRVLCVSLIAILLFGLMDDLRSLSWKVQSIFQIALGAFLWSTGIYVGLVSLPVVGAVDLGVAFPLVSLVVTILWVVGLTNALNWSDGIDGLSGGVSVIAASTLFLLALRPDVYQPPFAIIAVTLLGVALAFTIVNLRTKYIIAGTTGAYFMGATIAVLAIFAGAKIGTALLVCIVPIVDALSVIVHRLRDGKNIFRGDKRHMHHTLLAHGWQNVQILSLYYALTLFGAALALLMSASGKMIAFVLYAGLIFFALMLLNKKDKR